MGFIVHSIQCHGLCFSGIPELPQQRSPRVLASTSCCALIVSKCLSGVFSCIHVLQHWGFSALALLVLEPDSSLSLWNCPVLWRMFSSIPGLYLLDASSILSLSYDNQRCLQILPNICSRVGSTKIHWLRHTGLKEDRPFHQGTEKKCFVKDSEFPPFVLLASSGSLPNSTHHQ